MAYVISSDCVSCGACAGECPVGAIVEGDGKYEIRIRKMNLPTVRPVTAVRQTFWIYSKRSVRN